MGNLCITDDFKYHEYREKKYKCVKCSDMFKIQKNNTRNHCRVHTINENDICIDCCLDTTRCNTNCHHIRKLHWYSHFI